MEIVDAQAVAQPCWYSHAILKCLSPVTAVVLGTFSTFGKGSALLVVMLCLMFSFVGGMVGLVEQLFELGFRLVTSFSLYSEGEVCWLCTALILR